MIRLTNTLITTLVLAATFTLSACSNEDSEATVMQAAAIEASDQCHLCGMAITNFPGPKGELGSKDEEQVHKFCSTRDLFGFYLQPENKHRAQVLYVHDMSETPWAAPSDDHFIDAKTAHFVWGSSKKGAMGETLGSFSNMKDAMAFAEEFGGKVISFDDITLDLLTTPMAMNHSDMGTSEMPATEMNHDEMNHDDMADGDMMASEESDSEMAMDHDSH